MISGMWKNVVLVCGNDHEIPQEMYVRQTDKDAFYACPKYYPENRDPDERPCMNRISVAEMEHMLEVISEKIQQDEEEGGMCFLKNFTFETKVGKYKVLEHNADVLKIQVLNKKARIDL